MSSMKERPILFSGPMVRAILEGRKTQTRRPLKVPRWFMKEYPSVDLAYSGLTGAALEQKLRCPHGVSGDRLWVRETWAGNVQGCPKGISYFADHRDPRGDGPANPMRWTPSIHMPRAASRINLEVVAVRAQRLQEITQADAVAEGMHDTRGVWEPLSDTDNAGPRAAFRSLWDEINGKRLVNQKPISWDANPWVWAITFKVLR